MKQLRFCSISLNIRMDISPCFVLTCLHIQQYFVSWQRGIPGFKFSSFIKGHVCREPAIESGLSILMSAQDLQALLFPSIPVQAATSSALLFLIWHTVRAGHVCLACCHYNAAFGMQGCSWLCLFEDSVSKGLRAQLTYWTSRLIPQTNSVIFLSLLYPKDSGYKCWYHCLGCTLQLFVLLQADYGLEMGWAIGPVYQV